jgi:PKD repeat protein
VFYNRLGGGNEKYVAEAISHEAGHNLGLSHDGQTGGSAYYAGHGSGATSWAPIMGVGYSKSLVQWSKGEYTNANNTEDDLARIPMFGAPLRADDHGDTFAAATPLTATAGAGTVGLSGNGVIGTRTDVDMHSFSSGAGTIALTISPAARSANLDIQAELYDANGTLVASANPVDALNASISASNVAAGTYYLKVDGIGKGDLATGYSDYGSLGQYVVSGSAPAAADQAPIAIASATPTSGTAPVTVNFNGSGSYDPDGGALTYSWNFGDGSAASTVANPSHVYNAAGNYTATLTVTDPGGAAATTQILIAVASAKPTLHVEKIGMSVSIKYTGTRVTDVTARATAAVIITDASGKALRGATVSGTWSGAVSGTGSATTDRNGQAKLTSPSTKSRGTFTFTVTGVSLSGYTYNAAQNKLSSASIVY